MLYLIFGCLTTIVNIIVYYILNLYVDYMVSNAIAWIVSVLFAYVTNKIYVFKSGEYALSNIVKEFVLFVTGRVITGVLDMILMFTLINFFYFDGFISKIVVNVVVIILNYVFSKLLVFNMRGND